MFIVERGVFVIQVLGGGKKDSISLPNRLLSFICVCTRAQERGIGFVPEY